MNESPRVTALLSGKGGSGKSTVAISIARLLSDIGKSCLLVDLDLSTNGASYFFQSHLDRGATGVWELLGQIRSRDTHGLDVAPLPINDHFHFMPSRSLLRSKGVAYEDLAVGAEELSQAIVKPLLEWARVHDCAYVLIDCQAGYSIPSTVAAQAADLAVIVTEADAISSDAADNLLIQLGHALPAERRYLVNKIDVRDGETYRKMRDVFATLNRLPPLPFDFKVRAAFGAREMPVRTDVPSASLFALFETITAMFPELRGEFDTYRTEHVDRLFGEHTAHYDELFQRQQELESERQTLQASLRRQDAFSTSRFVQWSAGFMAAALAISAILYTLWRGQMDWVVLIMLSVVIVGTIGGSLSWTFLKRRAWAARARIEQRSSAISVRLRENAAKLDEYRSLILSQSREYLLDDAIARREADRE